METEKLQTEKLGILNERLTAYKTQLAEQRGRSPVNWVAVIIGILIGLALGYLLKGR